MKTFPLILILFFVNAQAEQITQCPSSDVAVTTPAPVNIDELKQFIHEIEDIDGNQYFAKSKILDQRIEHTFDTRYVKTKMEQFYTLLWELNQELLRQNRTRVTLSQKSAQNVLFSSGVFTNPTTSEQISSIDFDQTGEFPRITVVFNKDNIDVPLNKGQGFYVFRSGKCQHAEKLIFYRTFSFELKRNLGNLMVFNFNGVDLFGDFGNRGIIDVDIQYVSLKSVEFFSGTVNGRVTAYVSREEFNKNEHNFLLEMVTKIVPDRTVQPIDW